MTKRAKGTYHLISLGCPKNLVDSESMAQILNREGYVPASAPEDAAYLIVNTCGFLKAAREEALMVLTDLASEKLPWQKLIAAGCMTEHHRHEILQAVPGIDGFHVFIHHADLWGNWSAVCGDSVYMAFS